LIHFYKRAHKNSLLELTIDYYFEAASA